MTNFEKIKSLTIEELADYVADGKYPNLPHAPCYICKYDEGPSCWKADVCTKEFKSEVYRKWLSAEYGSLNRWPQ